MSSKEFGSVAFFANDAEQIWSFVNLDEESDTTDDSSFDLASISDDELYEVADAEREEEEEEEEPEEFHSHSNSLVEEFYYDDDSVLDAIDHLPAVSKEELDVVKNLTQQLLNKDEVNALNAALAKSHAELEAGKSLAPERDAIPEKLDPYLNELATYSFPQIFTTYAQPQPQDAIEVPFMLPSSSSNSEASSPDSRETTQALNTPAPSPMSSDSSMTPRPFSSTNDDDESEAEIDIEEIDSDSSGLEPISGTKRSHRFIEEEDDSDDDLSLNHVFRSSSVPSSQPQKRGRPTARVLSTPSSRHKRQSAAASPCSAIVIDDAASPASKPTSRGGSRTGSRASSRASSPAPQPSYTITFAAARGSHCKKAHQLEASLVFRIEHLFPRQQVPDLLDFLDSDPDTRRVYQKTDRTTVVLDLTALSQQSLQQISDFVTTAIQEFGARKLSEEEQSKPSKPPRASSSRPESPKVPAPSPQTTRGKSRVKKASREASTSSPKQVATSKPLPSTYLASPTVATISKKLKMEDTSEEEIDILGF